MVWIVIFVVSHLLIRGAPPLTPSPVTLPPSLLIVAPVVIHCKSGRRAAKAEEVLKQKGYTKVYNAGGLVDMPKATELPKSGADASSGGCSVM